MFLSQADIFTALIAVSIIGIILVLIQIAVRKKWLNQLAGRKLLHVTAISTCAFAIANFENRLLLAYILLIFFFILLWVIRRGWMQVNEEKTYGIALFPFAFAVLLFMPIFPKKIIVLSALILAISDALAGFIGEYYGKQKVIFLTEKKSCIGFAVFYCSAIIITCLYTGNYSPEGILFCGTFALLPAITELFSHRGSDNLLVPIFTAVWAMLIVNATTGALIQFWLLIFLFIAAAYLGMIKKWLTISGAVAAIWTALLLYSTGTFKAFIAPGLFLITGSLLSKLNNNTKEKIGRNAKQVFANGIIGVLLMIFYKLTTHQVYLIGALASYCISMTDTVSSELGVYLKGKVYNIVSLKKMQQGLSGGISAAGTITGFLSAFIFAGIVGYAYSLSGKIQIYIALTGFTGMIADSIFGSLLQAKYKTPGGLITEEPNSNKLYSGYRWCNNDAVNFLSNFFISMLFILFMQSR